MDWALVWARSAECWREAGGRARRAAMEMAMSGVVGRREE